jgi:nicotinamidase-related amidase
MHLPQNAALIIIDVQQAFDNPQWGQRNNPHAEQRVAELIAAWRGSERPIFHIQHINPRQGSLFNPATIGARAKAEAEPLGEEPVITKNVNSAFIGTDLEARLRAQKIETLVVVGITTDHCVSTTSRMAGNLGFDTFVVSDATATFERTMPDGAYFSAETMHSTALASLSGEFATIVRTDDVLRAVESQS